MHVKSIKPHRTIYRFAVEGRGTFPIDMLRHDLAWPRTELDSEMLECGRGLRTVQLVSASLTLPTIRRWNSYGWEVKEVLE